MRTHTPHTRGACGCAGLTLRTHGEHVIGNRSHSPQTRSVRLGRRHSPHAGRVGHEGWRWFSHLGNGLIRVGIDGGEVDHSKGHGVGQNADEDKPAERSGGDDSKSSAAHAVRQRDEAKSVSCVGGLRRGSRGDSAGDIGPVTPHGVSPRIFRRNFCTRSDHGSGNCAAGQQMRRGRRGAGSGLWPRRFGGGAAIAQPFRKPAGVFWQLGRTPAGRESWARGGQRGVKGVQRDAAFRLEPRWITLA